MKNSDVKSLLRLFLGSVLLAGGSAAAGTLVQRFGPEGTAAPQFIAPLNTVIGSRTDLSFEYRAIESSNTDIKFIRHILSATECLYWFREDQGPDMFNFEGLEEYSSSYWYAECLFVDGAQDGSNNFVLLHSTESDQVVGVLQYLLNYSDDINASTYLLAYAVNPDGMTFEEGVAAIQAIPEPSTVVLVSLVVIGAGLGLRRRR